MIVDQDVINANLYNSICLLDQKWNVEFRTDINYPAYYTEYLSDPYIIHFEGKDKPWHPMSKQNAIIYNFYKQMVESQTKPIIEYNFFHRSELTRRIHLFIYFIQDKTIPKNYKQYKVYKNIARLIAFPKRKLESNKILRDNLTLVESSGYFDRKWYLRHNYDVEIKKTDPLHHYILHGGIEGRSPGPDFDSQWYLDAYTDVKNEGINPLIHYLRYGRNEGKSPLPPNQP